VAIDLARKPARCSDFFIVATGAKRLFFGASMHPIDIIPSKLTQNKKSRGSRKLEQSAKLTTQLILLQQHTENQKKTSQRLQRQAGGLATR
jgi:hypothetical protein